MLTVFKFGLTLTLGGAVVSVFGLPVFYLTGNHGLIITGAGSVLLGVVLLVFVAVWAIWGDD